MLRDQALAPLARQHQNGLALCVLIDRAFESEAPAETVARLTALTIDRFDMEISNHFEVEEELVFPTVEKELGGHPLLAEFTSEHRRFEQIIDQLRNAPSVELLKEFSALLRRHIRREESEFFEEVEHRLPRQVLSALSAKIDTMAVRIPI